MYQMKDNSSRHTVIHLICPTMLSFISDSNLRASPSPTLKSPLVINKYDDGDKHKKEEVDII